MCTHYFVQEMYKQVPMLCSIIRVCSHWNRYPYSYPIVTTLLVMFIMNTPNNFHTFLSWCQFPYKAMYTKGNGYLHFYWVTWKPMCKTINHLFGVRKQPHTHMIYMYFSKQNLTLLLSSRKDVCYSILMSLAFTNDQYKLDDFAQQFSNVPLECTAPHSMVITSISDQVPSLVLIWNKYGQRSAT